MLKPAQRASLDELRPRLEAVRKLVRMRTDVPLDIEAVFKPRVPTVVATFMEDESNGNGSLTRSYGLCGAFIGGGVGSG